MVLVLVPVAVARLPMRMGSAYVLTFQCGGRSSVVGTECEEAVVELTVLLVPGCPTAEVLRQRLAEVLAGRADVRVAWREVGDGGEAVRLGMHGSPTLLVNGADPFVREGETASLSCRLPGALPSADQLRTLLAEGLAASEPPRVR
jgi:hypothetical protein